jgi:hypothetical protein
MSCCCACHAGHQLHFDSDDEGQGGVRHPIITCIAYLDGSAAQQQQQQQQDHSEQQQGFIGGPTLMTDQVLGGPLATRGWLAFPASNRVLAFDGRFLHGECVMRWLGCILQALLLAHSHLCTHTHNTRNTQVSSRGAARRPRLTAAAPRS